MLKKSLALLGMLVLPLSVNAGLVTLDPDSYNLGDVVTAPGATIKSLNHSSESDQIVEGDVVVGSAAYQDSSNPGDQMFVSSVSLIPGSTYRGFSIFNEFYNYKFGMPLDWTFGWKVLNIAFDQPTDFFQVTGVTAQGDIQALLAYDIDGNILASHNNYGQGEWYETCCDSQGTPLQHLTYTLNIPGIAEIFVAGDGGHTDIDVISYNNVPIPAAGWLFMTALLGLAGKKRLSRR